MEKNVNADALSHIEIRPRETEDQDIFSQVKRYKNYNMPYYSMFKNSMRNWEKKAIKCQLLTMLVTTKPQILRKL